jgi:hypothetical protein
MAKQDEDRDPSANRQDAEELGIVTNQRVRALREFVSI